MPAYSLEHIAAQLEAAGYAARARAIREAIRRLRDQHQTIETHKQELLTMANTFAESAAILIDHDAKATAANVALTTANADLTAKLTAALANARTPEEATAEQAVIDAATNLPAAAPVAPPAV